MTRWVPPVLSPVRPASLLSGAAAAAGLVNPDREALASQIAKTFAADEVVLTDSGTSALVLALRMAVAPGRTVAFPAYVCIDLTAAALFAGVSVRLYDVDPATLGPDVESLRRTVERGVDAIVVTPLFGYPVDMTAIASLAAERGIPIIEDAAQSAGATLRGTRVGAFGDLSVLSFGRGKGTTGGSGGALLAHGTRFGKAAREARERLVPSGRGLKDVAVLGAQWLLGRPSLYSIPASIPSLKLGEMVYHEATEPAALTASAASVLRTALESDPAEVRIRQSNAEALRGDSAEGRGVAPIEAIPGAVPGYLRFAVVDKSGKARAAPRLGVLRSYPVTLDEHPVTGKILVAGESAGNGARALRDSLFTLPTHSRCRPDDLARLRAWMRRPDGAAGTDSTEAA